MAVKCTTECGYESPKDMDVCPRCGASFNKNKEPDPVEGPEHVAHKPEAPPAAHTLPVPKPVVHQPTVNHSHTTKKK